MAEGPKSTGLDKDEKVEEPKGKLIDPSEIPPAEKPEPAKAEPAKAKAKADDIDPSLPIGAGVLRILLHAAVIGDRKAVPVRTGALVYREGHDKYGASLKKSGRNREHWRVLIIRQINPGREGSRRLEYMIPVAVVIDSVKQDKAGITVGISAEYLKPTYDSAEARD